MTSDEIEADCRRRACAIAAQLPRDPATCLRILGIAAEQVGEFFADEQSPPKQKKRR
jgi:hypothetical protein